MNKSLMLDSSDIIELVESIANNINERYALKTLATPNSAGLMSQTDKIKLDGINIGANNYIHPITAGFKHIPSGGSVGQILKWSSDGTAIWADNNETKYTNMEGATVDKSGKAGLVPAPAAGNQGKFLRADGTWATPKDTTYEPATPYYGGLMSADDKRKLDGLSSENNKYTHPTYSPASSALYKITVDNTGHIAVATPVSKNDIVALGIPPKDTTYNIATQSTAGLMSADDKAKLDGISTSGSSDYIHPTYTPKTIGLYKFSVDSIGHVSNANPITKADITALGIPSQDTVYTHPTTAGNKHIPAGGSSGQVLKWSADGTAVWEDDYEILTSSEIQSIVNSAFN